MKVRYLRLDEVLRIHELLMRAEGQLSALMDAGKLESAILRPAAQAFGAGYHPSFAEKAAVLIQGIVVAHPFVDGNKRLGLGCMLVFLAMNNIPLTADPEPLYEFVISVSTGELRRTEDIAVHLRLLFAPHLDA